MFIIVCGINLFTTFIAFQMIYLIEYSFASFRSRPIRISPHQMILHMSVNSLAAMLAILVDIPFSFEYRTIVFIKLTMVVTTGLVAQLGYEKPRLDHLAPETGPLKIGRSFAPRCNAVNLNPKYFCHFELIIMRRTVRGDE